MPEESSKPSRDKRDSETAANSRASGTRASGLNLDVFRLILQSCAVADLLRVGYVSRILREEAVQELLARPVHLAGNIQIESFCHLMLAGDTSRFPYLHTLIINHATHITPDTAGLLRQVISGTKQLRRLHLCRCEALFTQMETRFADAVSQLEHLSLLQVRVGKEVFDYIRPMVLRLRSTLKTLDVSYEEDDELGLKFTDEVAERQPQLHQLRICYSSLSPSSKSRWMPYPSLRVLTLSIGDQIVDLQCISQIFPNLRKLSFTPRHALEEVDFANPSDQIVAMRNTSIALQKDGSGWKSLEYLHGSVGDLYALGLTCPVRRVRLGQYDVKSHRAYIEIFARTRPRTVEMTAYCAPWVKSIVLPSPRLFVYGTKANVLGVASHLCLRVTVPTEEVVTIEDLILTISSFVAASRLEYLRVEIAESFGIVDSDYSYEPPTVHPKLRETMASIDIATLAYALANSGPFLRTIVLSPASRERTVWTVDHRDRWHIGLQRLDPFTAKRVVEREEQ
ncbi:hypothetical protein K466DRAFT_600717 [Polyporus arcularius HHB13444]|uniref:F-box domain-containing protein n=1 Tax=Polyporus arcularius HHB13444 TaxID=1314778 RepID=A0A5C3P8J7_9APHY|nr:hypothetical protein K466DRAFT_600717 [Polyporus arcularius HHB13444]